MGVEILFLELLEMENYLDFDEKKFLYKFYKKNCWDSEIGMIEKDRKVLVCFEYHFQKYKLYIRFLRKLV